MNSRERILTALHHREPDRVPFDLGSCQVTGIHTIAYQNLRKALGLPAVEVQYCDAVQQLASIEDDVATRLNIDTRGLYPLNSHNWQVIEEDAGDFWAYHDEWGITHHRPKDNGLYFSVVKVPLPHSELTIADIGNHQWPDVAHPQRLAGLRNLARQYRDAGYAVVLKDAFAGIFEFAQRIVGMENLLVMMITNEKESCALFDRLLELKLDYWQTALAELGDLVDVVTYADDYGTQTSQLISPDMFRRLIKPRLKVLLETLSQSAPHAKRFFHSDGNVRPLIPDLLEIGVDILNPIHIRAQDMAPAGLKRDFGRDLVFWGGGVDTQGILPHGTPRQVKDDVRRNIEALAPGGGYVFNTIHNIQAGVPPENIMAMWEALQEYGVY
jgi:uroporphyrinogen decarboxylase